MRRGDDWGSVEFGRSYNPDIAAVMRHVTDVKAYLDTVELYLGGALLTKTDAQFADLDARIKKAQQVRKTANPDYKLPWFDPVKWRGSIIGWRYVVNQPVKETLFLLDDMTDWPYVSLCRFDPSFDFMTETPYRANAVRLHLLRHLILRWCRSPFMPEVFGETTYWSKYKNVPVRERPTRNAAIYSDKPSKLTGKPCGHLDSRTIGSAAVRRQGIKKPTDLLDLNPAEHFARRFILVGDFWDQIEGLSKDHYRLRHRTQDFRAHMLYKYCEGFKLNRIGMEVLRLPTKITV